MPNLAAVDVDSDCVLRGILKLLHQPPSYLFRSFRHLYTAGALSVAPETFFRRPFPIRARSTSIWPTTLAMVRSRVILSSRTWYSLARLFSIRCGQTAVLSGN